MKIKPWLVYDVVNSLFIWKVFNRSGSKLAIRQINSGHSFVIRKNSGDGVAIWEQFYLKLYDAFLPQLFPGDTVIDIGAHIGTFTIDMATRFPGIKVISVEPFHVNQKLFQLNCELNEVAQQVTLVKYAIAGNSEPRKLFVDPGLSMSTKLSANGDGLSVQSLSLADLFEKHGITSCAFLKIDCEGAEYEALLACPDHILKRIRSLIIEWHDGGSRLAVKKKLHQNGFSTKEIEGFTSPWLRPLANVSFCVATREVSQVA